jgi:uncharacterized protein
MIYALRYRSLPAHTLSMNIPAEPPDLLPDDKPRLAPPVGETFSWRRVLFQLRHAAVRDLAYLLLSPPLLHPQHPRWQGAVQFFTEEELQVWRSWLLVQDMAPTALERFLAQESSNLPLGAPVRLGRYAEQLLGFALMNAPPDLHIHLLARNVLLKTKNEKTTAGELDFVIERQGVVEHWEMAVKFYLCIGNKSLDDFVSPAAFQFPNSPSDTLGTKLTHLFEKQLALHSLMQRAEVPEFADSGPITRSLAFVRGWLFYPAFAQGLSAASVPNAWGLHPLHPQGIWLKDSEAATLNPGSWLELPRMGWLSPARLTRNKADREYANVVLPTQATQATHAMKAPSLWAQMKKREDLSRQELQRAFVIPSQGTENA